MLAVVGAVAGDLGSEFSGFHFSERGLGFGEDGGGVISIWERGEDRERRGSYFHLFFAGV